MTQNRITHDQAGLIDEIVLTNALVHIEMLDERSYMLLIERDGVYFQLRTSNIEPYMMQVGDEQLQPGQDWRESD